MAATVGLRRVSPRAALATALRRVVHLLIGSALALSFITLEAGLVSAVGWHLDPVTVALVALIVVVPPNLLGLVPQVRPIEGMAAVSLLGADFGGHTPGEPHTWDQRWRTLAWFWAHLLAGAAAGVAVVAGALVGVQWLAAPVAGAPSWRWLSWVPSAGREWWLAGAGLLALVLTLVVLVLLGEVLVRLAPMLLGPSVPELLAELEARTAHLNERARVARELHDSVGHALSVVVLQSAAARRRLHEDPERAAVAMGKVEDVARDALADLDGVLALLRDESLPRDRQPVRDLTALDGLVRASREAGHQITVEGDQEALATLSGVVSREVYRIVQEGITNALRHAPRQPLLISLRHGRGELTVALVNPVAPRSATAARGGADGRVGGRGLIGVAERVRMFGGTVDYGCRDGVWRLEARLPLPRNQTMTT